MARIGITGNFGPAGCELAEAYYLSVAKTGSVPIIIPPILNADTAYIDCTLDGIDALMLSGGADLNPLLLGEEPSQSLHSINIRRDAFELALVRRAYQRQMPILGICRGIQVLAAALGGRIHQDIYSAPRETSQPVLLKHSQDAERWCATHTVALESQSLLASLFGSDRLAVNSFHHQAVAETGLHLRVSAFAPDGIIEAIESSEKKPILGVQWHPESFTLIGDESMQPLFRWLNSEAILYAKAKDIHSRIVTLDSHEDTPMFFSQNIQFGERDPRILVSLPLMDEGQLDCGIQVAYQPQGALDTASLQQARDTADHLLDGIERMVEPLADRIRVVKPQQNVTLTQQLIDAKAAGRHSILLGIENGYAFANDLSAIGHFRSRGVVYCTLCHNGCNQICDSAKPRPTDHLWGGLSPFGREVVAEMNRQGMTIDLSHASEQTFYDVLAASTRPVVCSHSNAYALCAHPRNLNDDQLRALAQQGGVVQVTLYHGFLSDDQQPATIDDVIRHLEYMINLIGIDHVGIGTDLDGDGGVPGVANAGELINITRELLRRGYSDTDIAKIWGLNFLRVLEATDNTNS